MESARPEFKRHWGHAALAAIILLALLVGPFCINDFLLDDAYITLHNARTLVSYGGADPVYRGATDLTGATSLVHLALVALAGTILPWIAASKFVTGVAAVLYAAGLHRLIAQHRLRGLDAAAVFLTATVTGYLLYHLFNGLETGLAMAIVIWAVVLAESRWLALLCGVMPFVRPELALLAGPLMLDYIYRHRHDRARIVEALLLAGAAGAPWMIWSIAATGSLIPNTALAKVLFFGELHMRLLDRISLLAGAVYGAYAAPLLILLPWLPRARSGIALGAFLMSWIGLSLFTFPAGLHQNFFRYLALLAPLLAVAHVAMITTPSRLPRWISGVAILWALGSGVAGLTALSDPRPVAARVAMAADVARLVPRTATILVHDAGYLAWAAPERQLYDLVGLKTPASSRWFRAQAPGPDGRARALAAIARESDAAYLVTLDPSALVWGAIPAELRSVGWAVHPLNRPARGGYVVSRLSAPHRR